MSILNIITTNAPRLGVFEFDAVLESTLELNADISEYVIESGAIVNDHRIIRPAKWFMRGMMTNTPFKFQPTDFIGALTNFVPDSGIAATVAGISIGLLAGSNETRASAALNQLIELMVTGSTFTVVTGHIDLKNMLIKNISSTRNTENENGLEFEVELQELATLDTVGLTLGFPTQNKLRDGDPAKTQATALIEKGEATLAALSSIQTSQLSNFFS